MSARDDLLAELDRRRATGSTAPGALLRDCWTWAGATAKSGYGVVRLAERKYEYVHRISYQWAYGAIPADRVIDHLCRNRACVNPGHLELVSVRENTRRGVGPAAQNAAKTHCPRDHEYTPENTYIARHKDGSFAGRKCIACEKARSARRSTSGRAV